jgi:hypothetical protein
MSSPPYRESAYKALKFLASSAVRGVQADKITLVKCGMPRDAPQGCFTPLPPWISSDPGPPGVPPKFPSRIRVGVVIPCYSEDADSLHRTLMSLAIQQYELARAYGSKE